MTAVLSDHQITNLMTEVKSLPDDYRCQVVPRQKRGTRRVSLTSTARMATNSG